MGNSSTKEERPPFSTHSRVDNYHASGTERLSYSGRPQSDANINIRVLAGHPSSSTRTRRRESANITSIISRANADPDLAGMEDRKETKAEREARKREKERVARLAERERSMREENVDGGFLVTQGVYVGPEDFSKQGVRQLMIERRLAPFWRGLNDWSESWTERQLTAAARGLPIPPADEILPNISVELQPPIELTNSNLAVPDSSTTASHDSASPSFSPARPPSSLPSSPSPVSAPRSTSPLFRGRSKTLAALTTKYSGDISPREIKLPENPFVNGQPIEVYLYKDAIECPICFLYYPPYLNHTRCCDQPICSECFVQIKRPDPHIPESHPDPNHPEHHEDNGAEEQLVSEPAACPFCVQPELGITYTPPQFRRGLTYGGQSSLIGLHGNSAMSSSSSLSSSGLNGSHRRRLSLSADAANVITTDRIRPDWAQKLAHARATAARRAAAATALHTAAYLMTQSDGRSRRSFLRRSGGDSPSTGGNSPHPHTLSSFVERHRNHDDDRGNESSDIAPPRSSSRRSRMDDLEEMMMMEAIRLSLAEEEERRRKEEKEAKKQAKKKQKEAKKAEKAAKKGLYLASSNSSFSRLMTPGRASASSLESQGKGKSADRPTSAIPSSYVPTFGETSEESSSAHTTLGQIGRKRSSSQPIPNRGLSIAPQTIAGPSRPSHLRQMSNASSSTSSFNDSGPASGFGGSRSSFDRSLNPDGLAIPYTHSIPDSFVSGTPPGGGAGVEPMFNFQSLAAMIGKEERCDDKPGIEQVEHSQQHETFDYSGSLGDMKRTVIREQPENDYGDFAAGESTATASTSAIPTITMEPAPSDATNFGKQPQRVQHTFNASEESMDRNV